MEQQQEEQVDLEVGAPPRDLGSSESTLDSEQREDEAAEDLDATTEAEIDEEYDFEDEEQPYEEGGEPPVQGPRGVRGGESGEPEKADGKSRGRVLNFLANSWAELQRVQWPNRQAVISLTGVVLGFVLLAGGYLGALDAVFSRIIESII